MAGGVGLLLALSLAACGPEATRDVKDSARWRTSQAPVDTTGLIWSTGTTVNFPDGTVIDMGTKVHGYLVAGDGVFFFPLEGEDGPDDIIGRELWFAAPNEEPEPTGLVLSGDALVASPDGQHLAAVIEDRDRGDATVVGYDLTTGDEWRSDDGMDGPVDEIDEFEVQATGVDNEFVYGLSFDGEYAWDLDTGQGHSVADGEAPVARRTSSPDGNYWITDGQREHDIIEGLGGRAVPLDIENGRAVFDYWIDSNTAVGKFISPALSPTVTPDDFIEIITCEVPSGDCVVHHEIQGDEVMFPMQGDDGYSMLLYQISGIPEV